MAVPYESKKDIHPKAKEAIAKVVCDRFIVPNQNPRIWIDAGTSAVEVAKAIAHSVKHGSPMPTVVTNNLGAWEIMKGTEIDRLDLYLVGGRYNKVLNALIELRSYENALKQWNPNVIVIAVSGINDRELYCSNVQDESPVKKALATKLVETRIIIADHTKIGRTDFGGFLELKSVSESCDNAYLVTDEYDVRNIESQKGRDKYEQTIQKFESLCGKGSVVKVPVHYPIESKITRKDVTKATRLSSAIPQ